MAADAPNDAMVVAAVESLLETLDLSTGLTVVVNDPQRATRSRTVLEVLTEWIPPAAVRVLIATGSHTFDTARKTEFVAALTGGLGIRLVQWHDARSEKLATVGRLWRGHRWLLEPPAVLAVGSVEPHYFAGFTGAHKTCTIGCASLADITANHAMAADARCRPCVTESNPVHEGICEMLAALQSHRDVHAVNIVQVGQVVAGVASGPPLKALASAADVATELMAYPLTAPADVVVAHVTGPLGANFYQAEKGLKNNERAARDGGAMVLVADCSEGMGPSHFTQLLAAAETYEQAAAIVRRDGYRLGDHKALRLRYLTDPACRNVRLFLVSGGLSESDARLLHMTQCPTVEDAIAAAGVEDTPETVRHVTDAANTCPRPL